VKPVVAIVGRVNVGKSTLFNRLTQSRIAIVEAEPGITRDRIYADAEWRGLVFTLVDTGGIEFGSREELRELTVRQAEIAISEADLVLMLVDARAGVTGADSDVADVLRRASKPVLLVANKSDSAKVEAGLGEFYELGLGEPLPVSAEHGIGTGDLLDAVLERLPGVEAPVEETAGIRVAVIGRPNVGKSSLVNSLLGQERVIVSDTPGTTRDAIDVVLVRDGQSFVLVDTAGLRRKGRITSPIERYGVIRTLKAVDRADVVLLLIDATVGLTEQDKRIAGYVHEAGRGLALVVNKWDLVERDEETARTFEVSLRDGLPFLEYAPILFISAKTGLHVSRLLEKVKAISAAQTMRVVTHRVTDLIKDAMLINPPPAEKGKRVRVHLVQQVSVKPPVFLFIVNDPTVVHYSYRRFLENRLREVFDFSGTPLRLIFRAREGKG
jgi:GTP-binding protein